MGSGGEPIGLCSHIKNNEPEPLGTVERRNRPFSAAQPVVWLNGRLLLAGRAQIDPSDRGLLLGDGLFETMRATNGAVPLLDRHLDRLHAAAEELDIPVPIDDEFLPDACASLLRANRLNDAVVRLTLTRGPGPRGLLPPDEAAPTLLMAAYPLPGNLQPARTVVAEVTRRNQRSPLSRMKTLGYLDNLLALREAHDRGADDALLLNTVGHVACATAANLFVIEQDRLLTPPPSEGVLPGVTRGLVFELAEEIDVECREEPLPPERLAHVAAAFLTSCITGLRSIVSIDGQTVGGGQPHPLAVRLQQLWQARTTGS